MLSLALLHDAVSASRAAYALHARNLCRQCRSAEIACKCRLSRKELFGRPLPLRHRMQAILPDRRRIGVGHCIGERVNEEVRLRRRREHLFLARRMEKFAADQILDDACTRRLGANAGDIAQHLLCRLVLHVFMDFLHALQEGRGRKARGRLRLPRAKIRRHVVRRIPLLHWGQDGALLILLLRIFRLTLSRAVQRAPPRRTLCTSARREQFTVIRDLHLRLVVDVVRVELCNVGACDQLVDIFLHGTETCEIHGDCRRNNRVMRRDLRIVPRARLLLRIGCLCPRPEFRLLKRREVAEDLRRILVLTHGQILCIRARIARKLFLVKFLRRIEYLLRLIAVSLARKHLKRRQ